MSLIGWGVTDVVTAVSARGSIRVVGAPTRGSRTIRIFVDTADPAEIEEWDAHPWVSGFTTNPTLVRAAGSDVSKLVALTNKPISIDGPPEVLLLGENVYRKVVEWPKYTERTNYTAVCTIGQLVPHGYSRGIISVFAGRIMDTGRDPQPIIDEAKKHGQVLWASVREPYNITQAEKAGCDVVTVPPTILRKYLEWNGLPLEVVAERTIAQFDAHR